MSKIRVLDCTLRDGGYVNNWAFGKACIEAVKGAVEKSGADFIEMGLIQDISYNPDRTIYDNPSRVKQVIGEERKNTIYGALIEMSNYFPQEKLPIRKEGDPTVLRYSFWKRLLDDALNYGRQIAEKGYRLCCQPTRAEQYSDIEFANMCRKFGKLQPYGVYIVDTFGLLNEEDVVRFARIANENLDPEIVLGYHAHDNSGMAYRNVCAFLEYNYGNRILQVDASIFGIGRGAGNLRLEQIYDYLNYKHGTNYDTSPLYEVWDSYINRIYGDSPWGYDLIYFVTARNHCNPSYASYYIKKGLSVLAVEKIVTSISGVDRYLYNDDKAEMFIREFVKED